MGRIVTVLFLGLTWSVGRPPLRGKDEMTWPAGDLVQMPSALERR